MSIVSLIIDRTDTDACPVDVTPYLEANEDAVLVAYLINLFKHYRSQSVHGNLDSTRGRVWIKQCLIDLFYVWTAS